MKALLGGLGLLVIAWLVSGTLSGPVSAQAQVDTLVSLGDTVDVAIRSLPVINSDSPWWVRTLNALVLGGSTGIVLGALNIVYKFYFGKRQADSQDRNDLVTAQAEHIKSLDARIVELVGQKTAVEDRCAGQLSALWEEHRAVTAELAESKGKCIALTERQGFAEEHMRRAGELYEEAKRGVQTTVDDNDRLRTENGMLRESLSRIEDDCKGQTDRADEMERRLRIALDQAGELRKQLNGTTT